VIVKSFPALPAVEDEPPPLEHADVPATMLIAAATTAT
jgi:hypothetical protein